jgi:signal transduction histidine kinase
MIAALTWKSTGSGTGVLRPSWPSSVVAPNRGRNREDYGITPQYPLRTEMKPQRDRDLTTAAECIICLHMRKYLVWQVIFIIVFGFLAVVPILVGTYFALNGFTAVMFRTISNNLTQTASDKAARINQWIYERTLDMKGIGGVEAVRQAVGDRRRIPEAAQFLRLIKHNYGYYDEICIADPSGARLITTREGAAVGTPCPHFSYSLSGGVTVSDVQVIPPDTEPTMYLAMPIGTAASGVLVARIDLRQLDSITQDIHIGRTAEAYLLNPQGYFITGSKFEPGVRLRRKVDTKGFRDCLKNHKGVDIYPDYRGEMVLGSYVYMPGRNWCLMVEQDRNEALEPIRQLRGRVTHLSLLAMALVLVFVIVTSNVIVGRIRRGDALLEVKRRELTRAERLVATGRLAAGIAHEINNPINSIMNCATLMIGKIRKNEIEPGYFTRFLTSIETECRRTARIIREFLDFSRETGPRFALVNLNEIVQETLVLLEPEAEQRKILIEKVLMPGLPDLTADRDQLKQAFRNIILNAYEAMPTGGRLKIATRRNGRNQEVEFADTGVGIPPENLDRVFDPFFTTKSGGSGLGLSVVYGIIDRHDGKIEVAGEPGKGTRFTIQFPPGRKSGGSGDLRKAI